MKALPEGPFDLILVDPPWDYKDKRNRASTGAARSAYPCMTMAALYEMDDAVRAVCSKNAYIFMWATKPKTEEALMLMKVWGFKYLTDPFVWVKVNRVKDAYTETDLVANIGHYTRTNTEKVMMGRRGKTLPVLDLTVREVVIAPRRRAPSGRKHSTKPAEVRDRIVRLFGDRPRLELFAGETCPGWVSWGNEV